MLALAAERGLTLLVADDLFALAADQCAVPWHSPLSPGTVIRLQPVPTRTLYLTTHEGLEGVRPATWAALDGYRSPGQNRGFDRHDHAPKRRDVFVWSQ